MEGQEIIELLNANEEKNAQNIEAFKKDLQKVRTGRATSSLLDSIQVDYYGSRTALSHLGQISAPEPRLIVINVYDVSAIEIVEKAIRNADMGLNPSRDGNTLRVKIPTLTEESRKEIVKHLHKHAEEVRVFIRNNRRDANDSLKKLEKAGGYTQDEVKKAIDQVQKQTDANISIVDELSKKKEAECMTV